MSRRICILADVRYVIGTDTLDVYKIESTDGLPKADWEPVHTEPREGDSFELWRCNNCGHQFPNWEQTKPHLGRFHDLIDPFNYPEETKNPAG